MSHRSCDRGGVRCQQREVILFVPWAASAATAAAAAAATAAAAAAAAASCLASSGFGIRVGDLD